MDGDIEIALVGTGMITIHPDGLGFLLVRGRKTVFKVRPRQQGESIWRVIQRAIEVLAKSDEIGG